MILSNHQIIRIINDIINIIISSLILIIINKLISLRQNKLIDLFFFKTYSATALIKVSEYPKLDLLFMDKPVQNFRKILNLIFNVASDLHCTIFI